MSECASRNLREAIAQETEANVQKPTEGDEPLFDLARQLTNLGQTEKAKLTYIELLKKSPGHFGALNNLGALLHEMGYRTAARTVYAEVVARHPQNPPGHVNLANALCETGDLAQAREHCERALALSPGYEAAHQALASILANTGDEELAAWHRRAAFKKQNVINLPYRGAGTPISLLLLVSAAGGNLPIRHLLDDQVFQTSVIYADYWNTEIPLPPHDLVFNTVGDADLCKDALEFAVRLLVHTDAPVVNPPTAVLGTGRVENATRLVHLAGVKTAKTETLSRATLCGPDAVGALSRLGFDFPLLLRTPGFHTGRHFARIEIADELSAAASALPGKELTAIEYLDARGRDGKARKYRAMFVNGNILPLHLAISSNWKVHYFTAETAICAEHRAEEERFLKDMAAVIGARGMAALEHIRDVLGLDYAGIDFGLNANREVLFFEANATMVVNPPDPGERLSYRREAIEQIHAAVCAMLVERAKTKSHPPTPATRALHHVHR